MSAGINPDASGFPTISIAQMELDRDIFHFTRGISCDVSVLWWTFYKTLLFNLALEHYRPRKFCGRSSVIFEGSSAFSRILSIFCEDLARSPRTIGEEGEIFIGSRKKWEDPNGVLYQFWSR